MGLYTNVVVEEKLTAEHQLGSLYFFNENQLRGVRFTLRLLPLVLWIDERPFDGFPGVNTYHAAAFPPIKGDKGHARIQFDWR